MEIDVPTLCRFCAEPKSPEKLFHLDLNSEKLHEITEKLSFLNAVYVDLSCNIDDLPKTVCFVCYNSLSKSYDFLLKVKQAQDILWKLVTSQSSTELLLETDKNSGFNDFDEDVDSKDQSTSQKVEVKDEQENDTDQTCLFDPTNIKCEGDDSAAEGLSEIDTAVEDLDVQHILDVALNNGTDSNFTFYAAELKDLSKISVKTWNDFPWICFHCGIQFESLNTLRSHSKEVHEKCYAFVCDCKGYNNKNDFRMFIKHVIKKHFKNLSKQCYYCNEELPEAEKLTEHIEYHLDKAKRPCPSCGEILQGQKDLEEHSLMYGVQKRKPRRKPGEAITIKDLTCEICKKVYKNLNSVRDHRKTHKIQRNRDYTCERCGKTFYQKGSLKSHIQSHDQIRPHVCKICNKSFLFANMLRRHVDMHSGNKPFSCEQCGKKFRLRYQLKAHQIIHTDIMPYSCRFCNKQFRFKQIMTNHERQHTGVKPYGCEHCGMEFTNWSNFNKHMKRRHNMDQSKKKITPEGVFTRNPETGQLIQFEVEGVEEWKTKIMKPSKRGKKKIVKEEDS